MLLCIITIFIKTSFFDSLLRSVTLAMEFKMKKIKILTVALVIVLVFAVLPNAQAAIRLEAFHSLQRIMPQNQVRGEEVARIQAARNEYEAFQIAIIAEDEKLKEVRVEMSDLQGDEAGIGRENIVLYREEYVVIRHSSPRTSEPPGLYPDALLPLKNPITGEPIEPLRLADGQQGRQLVGAKYSAVSIEIFPGRNRVIWVDVYVPKGTPAGQYRGVFRAVAEGDVSAEIPVELTVWNFTLPDTATHRTHFGGFSRIAGFWGIDPDSEEYREIEKRFCLALARHRINPPIPHHLLPQVNDDGSLTILPERHKKLVQYIKETHLRDFEVPRAPFMSSTSNSPRATPESQTDPVAIEKSKRYYRQYYHYLKRNGWEKRAYLYMLDEPNSVKDYQQVINLGRVVKQAAPELKCLVVEQTYKHDPSWPEIDPYIDIWCPLFGFIDRQTIREKIAGGDAVWSYTALVQPPPKYHPQYAQVKDKNPPYWEIDFPPISYRIPLWINKQYGITGLLYWTTVYWKDDPFNEPFLGPYPVRYVNGEGMLFYPGKLAGFDGPVVSIRLKNIREGLEDYEYFAILEKMGEHQFVREILDGVSPTWWNFARDGRVLFEARERMARRIVGLGD